MFRRFFSMLSLFWQLLRVFFQLLYGFWRISKVSKPVVTIFGGSRVKLTDFYAQQAHKLATLLVNHDISVITGGGPGIMEAANCALPPAGGKAVSMGIGVKNLSEGPNKCVKEYFELDYFFARKWLMMNYSDAFVVFPGGYGTLDELSDILTLMQTKKLARVPIILFGKEYWKLFLGWAHAEPLKHKFIAQEELELITITDDLDEAFGVILNHTKKRDT